MNVGLSWNNDKKLRIFVWEEETAAQLKKGGSVYWCHLVPTKSLPCGFVRTKFSLDVRGSNFGRVV